ncbi:hypothetical protein ACFL6U_14665 [Planctomycetota bacterium]
MKILVLTLLLVQGALAETAIPVSPEGKKWIPVASLSDEFNSDHLDPKKWNPKHPFWSGRNSTHTVSNVSVGDGNLRLLSTLRPGATEVKAETITAACMASTTPRSRPGYYEARIKCSDISMTSAFWFQGKYSEIDVIENIGRATEPNSAWINQTMMMNTHFYKEGWDKDRKTPVQWKMPVPASEDYQVYGVWWKDEKTVCFFYNGTQVAEVTTGGPFDEGQYLYFDTEVFTWHGWPTQASLLDPTKNTMLIDWVRAWTLTDDVKVTR